MGVIKPLNNHLWMPFKSKGKLQTNLAFSYAIRGQFNVREVALAQPTSSEVVRPDPF